MGEQEGSGAGKGKDGPAPPRALARGVCLNEPTSVHSVLLRDPHRDRAPLSRSIGEARRALLPPPFSGPKGHRRFTSAGGSIICAGGQAAVAAP